MRLTTADIDRYGPLTGCRPQVDDTITVIAGPNESGKTLYLEGILQLLEPDVAAHMDSGPRVDQSPTGRVIVDDGSDRHSVGDGTTLSDISRIEPNHLYNLFVIRDSDLAFPDGPDYYTSLVEHLGEIHTTEIASIRDGLVDEGRVTPTTLNLANREYDTKDAKQAAEDLAEDIDAYLETATETNIPDLERERFSVRRELQTVEAELATQKTAKELAVIDEAAEQLDTYRTATDELQGATVDRETLSDLREQEQSLGAASDRMEELRTDLDRKQDELAAKREALGDAREREAELEQRNSDVEGVETKLDTYREQTTDVDTGDGAGTDSRLSQRRSVTIAALVGAGLAGGGGAVAGAIEAMVLGVILLVVGIGAWLSHRRLTSRVQQAATQEQDVLQAARDAGFDVDELEEVAPAIREYRTTLDAAKSRVTTLEAEVDQLKSRVEELERELQTKATEREELQNALSDILAEADVGSVEAYEKRVEALSDLETRRSEAAAILERELGEPEADSPGEKIAFWEAELAARRGSVADAGVEAEAYAEAELERLETKQSELESRLERIEADLDDHQDQLEDFERRATDISPPPSVGMSPSLEARSVEGLRELASDLEALSRAIERNADISRKAIGILDSIKADEEQKVATLFDPDGPASRTLEQLTDGRYTAVDYDPDAESLEVQTADERVFTPEQLSRGTRDQLYFAARLSLATQLLAGDEGFLLLDDPFLAADSNRLRNGFETLQELANEGWQILYLTAKDEVQDGMVDEFGCDLYELEMLD